MVVSAHPIASEIGVEILKKGGNAIDAAIAVGFALAVVYPSAGNLGGGGFMVIRSHEGETTSLDFRETAPSLAHRDMYLDSIGDIIPGLSLESSLAAGVPGTVDGLLNAHNEYGTLPLETLLTPSIKLAMSGYTLTEKESNKLNLISTKIKSVNPDNDYFQKEEPWNPGDSIIQKDLAETLKLILKNGRAGFYEGETAEKILNTINRDNEIMTQEDLNSYSSKWRIPVEGRYKNYNIISMPPPSSGGILLIQLLKFIEKYPVKEWGKGIKTYHLMIEAERRAYADRSKYLGDPEYTEVPTGKLLESQYIDSRFSDFNPERATVSDKIEPGSIDGYDNPETTHYSIIDPYGNSVATTITLNDTYGSKIFVTGSGFVLNNEMDDFSSKPGTPNLYGLVGGEANSIEPGKRMLSSMTPTIIEKDDDLFMVLGSPGGSRIITSVFQTFLNVVEHDMSIQQAVTEPRFHHQWLPDLVLMEPNAFDTSELHSLSLMNHSFKIRKSIGRVDAILVDEEGTLKGGADPRGDDTAIGYKINIYED